MADGPTAELSSPSEANAEKSDPIQAALASILQKPKPLTSEERFLAKIVPTTSLTGGKGFEEPEDTRAHHAHPYPWASTRVPLGSADPHHGGAHSSGSAPSIPEPGFQGAPQFDTLWEKLLAYGHGLYHPDSFKPPASQKDIAREAKTFAGKVHRDAPEDACRYLMIEEYKCLKQNHFTLAPQRGAHECLKWFSEWSQCQWDQEKMRQGYNYIELAAEPKRRPAYSTPNFRYA